MLYTSIQALSAKSTSGHEENTDLLTARLESLTEELEAFAYSVSHDLRAPVRHIRSFASLIQKRNSGKLDEKSSLYLQHIIASAERMGKLIDDLLAFSRISKEPVRQIYFDLKDLVNDIIREEFMLETQHRTIKWKIEELGRIRSDPLLLRQVFTNLISNALKFTMPVKEPEIQISKLEEEQRTIIFIKDNGVGFNNKYADRAFDVFYRLHREGEFEGTGIGLAIVKRIMTRCNAEVWAEGEENQGATFYLGFPLEMTSDQRN